LFWTDNILVSPEDYTIVPVVNPLDPSETIPIYNLNANKRGQVQQVDRNSDRNQRTYNGFDVGFTARVRGGNVYGGMSTGRQLTVTCDVEDPNSQRYCDHRELGIPYLTQFKVAGTYPLPYGVQVSGSWQGYPGVATGTARQDAEYDANLNRVPDPSLNANYIVDRTIVPSLTQASVTVPLLQPGTRYLDRWNQIDLRLAKKFDVRGVKLQAQFDIFNILNANNVLSVVETFGPSLNNPTSILQGRLFAVGAQMTF
jgi:hypothetical protein